jgi:hypothetical protein
MFDEADLIHRYTRAEAIADGVLIDVSAVAREAGIRWPVALTRATWERCVTVPPGVLLQDESGRLWDVLFMLACAVRCGGSGPEVRFTVHVRNDNRERTPPLVRLKVVCGPGDRASPAFPLGCRQRADGRHRLRLRRRPAPAADRHQRGRLNRRGWPRS